MLLTYFSDFGVGGIGLNVTSGFNLSSRSLELVIQHTKSLDTDV